MTGKKIFFVFFLFLFGFTILPKSNHAYSMPCETYEPDCDGEGDGDDGEEEPERPEDPEGPDTVGEGI